MKFKKMILVGAALCTLTACSDISDVLDEVENEGLVILQVYGNGGKDDGAVNRSFIELYNNTDNDIVLDGYTINYTIDSDEWLTYGLTGEIKKQSSYLISGTDNTNNENSYYGTINDSYSDMVIDLEISNDGFALCLLSEDNISTNPSSLDSYIDMVGAGITLIYETNPIEGISKQKSARRTSLVDTNDNSNDYEIIDFRTDNMWDKNKPYSSVEESRNPFPEKVVDENDNTLLIYQVYGTGGKTDGAINRSFIELYNNSDEDISLTGYVIYYMTSSSTNWEMIELTGTIYANSSFLIVGSNNYVDGNSYYGVIEDSDADMIIDLEINNDAFSICLFSSPTDLTVSDNPYLLQNDSYIDMVGAGSTAIFENDAIEGVSKQKSIIRLSLQDTNNNSIDFGVIDYRIEGNWDLYKPI